MVTRSAWIGLAVALVGAAGCAQALGLGDYGQLPEEAGAEPDATMITDSGDGGARASEGGDGAADVASSDAGDSGALDVAMPMFESDACSGLNACAPAPPAGWQGPVALWQGTGTEPACSMFYLPAFQGGLSPSTAGAQCGCSCDSPTGSTCGPVSVDFASGCSTSSPCNTTMVAPGACVSAQSIINACGGGTGFTVSGSAASGGSCLSKASVTVPTPMWGTEAVACQPSGQSPVGCASGQVCIPVAAPPFGSSFCVEKAGNSSCPSGFPTMHLYYGGFDDTRGCSPCSCGTPSGVDCNGGQVTTWGNPNCSANQASAVAPPSSACTPTGGVKSIKFATSPDGGSCAPDGGQPTGTLAAQTVTTICCTP